MTSTVYQEIRRISRLLVIETILLPSQNFSSRIERPDSEVNCRLSGHRKIRALALFGMKVLIDEKDPRTQNLSFWKIFSELIEHTDEFSLVESAKMQCILIDELIEDIVLCEDLFGKTPEEIFGFLKDPSTKEQLFRMYRLYLSVPKKPKRIQRHRGYRDKGSLGGDKVFLQARNLTQDSYEQFLIEQRRDYYYSFTELRKQILEE